jgi:hypothetical protein
VHYSDGTKRVLVAFGDASVTSSGFGYAPVPQKRLRLRLELIHGARVTLISEFYTSKMCHRCEGELQKCYHRDRRPDARAIHGILSCSNCRTEKDCRQFWHRDVNACRNMIRIYLTLASERKRPGYLTVNEEPYFKAWGSLTTFVGATASDPTLGANPRASRSLRP